jgi:hypothetical protein
MLDNPNTDKADPKRTKLRHESELPKDTASNRDRAELQFSMPYTLAEEPMRQNPRRLNELPRLS